MGEEPMNQSGLDFNEREVVLRADLSMLDELECVWTPVRFIMNGPRAPQPGERVLLVDTGGTGSCIGRVVALTGWEACVRPDWETWAGTAKAPPGHMLPPQSFGRGPTAGA
jgi:hypothetical protein